MQNMYKNAFSPEFVFRRIIGIKNLRKYKILLKALKFIINHITDFK